MSTGDLHGNLQRLLRELKAIKCPADIDEVGLRLGDPVALLPLLNFVLLKFSRHVARLIVRHGFELAGKTDQRFVESCFKLFRDVLSVRTVLTPAHFFEQGFAERKVLLLCDVIAVCKKLHNEEVRQERLAALKATRQDQVSTRLAAPRRTSPQVKVVRNDDIEIQQVLAPQHLPNASDGSQSVYKTTKVLATARSPSPSPGVQPTAGKVANRRQRSPNPPLPSRQEPGLELTFRAGLPANTGRVAQRQAPGGSAAAPPPIHTWFMNPAFADGDEGASDLGFAPGVGLGAAGRPDSSAWWRLAPSPEQQAEPTWWNAGGSQGAVTDWPNAAGGSGDGEASSGRHLFFGRQPAVATATGTAPQGSVRQAASQSPMQRQQQPEHGPLPLQHHAPVPAARKGGVAGVAAAARCGDAAVQGSSRTLPPRDLDEWSFSKYFGPGKAVPRRSGEAKAGDNDIDDSSQHAGDMEDGVMEGARGHGDAAGDGNDFVRDEPAPDLYNRFGAAVSSTSRPVTAQLAPTGAPGGTASSPTRLQRRPAAATDTAAAVRPASTGDGTGAGAGVDWQAQMAKLERETQQQVHQLNAQLASLQQELDKTRLEARQSRDALQARVTVLEGRVRFLECELETCVKRAPGQSPPREGSPGQAGQRVVSPPALGAPSAEPSLAWSSPGRQRSADSAALHHPRGSPSQPAAAGYPDLRYDGATSGHSERARPSSAAAAAPGFAGSGFAAPGALEARLAAPQAPGGDDGLRWGAQPVAPPGSSPTASLAARLQHLSYGAAGGLATQAGPPARAPLLQQQHGLGHSSAAAPGTAAPPSSLPGSGSASYRALPSFSPMPQPAFSFQPSSLMQQVASAAAPPQQQQQHGPALRLYSSSVDSAKYAATGPEASYNLDPVSARAAGHLSSSLDAGLRRPALSNTADGTVAEERRGAYGAGDAPWRGSERFAPQGALPASILDRAATREAAMGGGSGLAQQQEYRDGGMLLMGPDVAVGTNSGQQQHYHAFAQPPSENPAVMPHVASFANLPQQGMPDADGGTGMGLHRSAAPSAGGVGTEGGPGSGAPGMGAISGDSGSRNATDVINSLYLRYTEASDFLQTLRKR